MNIAQTKQIDIVDFLKAIGCFPTRETACAAWFRAPYREDMTPSFKVNKNRNIWYDFGLARSGDIIDLGILIYRTNDISRVLKLIENATWEYLSRQGRSCPLLKKGMRPCGISGPVR